ncbi:MAG: hypothetical protein JWN65_589 [Solirubrobacterales bacterium]|nr:hypothetical protein [Solirubrobacterales bacterium]
MALTTWARDHPDDVDVLLRVRDEVFTLRETLATLQVPQALTANEEWRRIPHIDHRKQWPTASDAPS